MVLLGPLAEISVSRALGHSIFIYAPDFFHFLIKSTIVGNKRQQKQLLLFLSNMSPKLLPSADLSGVAGDPLIAPETLN